MRYEWFVEKWKGSDYAGRTPHAMTKSEAESIALAGPQFPGNEAYTFKVVHRKELTEAA